VTRILIIHDSQEEKQKMRVTLESVGFQVVTAENNQTALRKLYQTCPHTVIMADNSAEGHKLCSHIRGISNIPIVVLGSGDEIARVTMLELGADVYLGQTVIAEELIARVRSLLRRYKGVKPANPNFNPETNRVELGGRVFNLTPTEFRLFSCLALNQGKVVPYSELIADVWGRKISPDTVYLYIRRLKQRLGIDSVGPYRLLKYRGQGCCFAEDKATVRTDREVMPIDKSGNEYQKPAAIPCW